MTDPTAPIRARLAGDPWPEEYAGDVLADMRALLEALDAERAKLTAMHRRAQRAEGAADRFAEGRQSSGPGLGRALANYTAHRAVQERDEARAALASAVEAARRETAAEAVAIVAHLGERPRSEVVRRALAVPVERRCAPCLGTGWRQGGLSPRPCEPCGMTGRAPEDGGEDG